MNSLLKFATEAHGGLDRWNQLSSLAASVSVIGALWQIKGKPDILKDIRIELTLHLAPNMAFPAVAEPDVP